MEWNWTFLFRSFLLLTLHLLPQSAADDCIDMDLHSMEVARCCRYEPISTEEVAEKCYQELAPNIPPNSSDFPVCFIDCSYRQMGYITNEANEIDQSKYGQFLAGFDTAFKIAVERAVAACATVQEDIRRDVANVPSKCNAFALLFHVCVTQITLKHCPDDRWTASEICGKSIKVASCCQLEAFLTLPTYGNCLQTMAEKYPDAVWQGTVCAFDCTYREMGILTGVDDINVEQISTNQAGYDQAYQEAIAKAVTACMAQKDKIREEADVVQSECSMFAVKFHACVSLETMRNCPAERWDSSVLCEKVRSGVTVCPL
uniref:uncharacterized protein LOC120950750 n=1 Tax=Anopheles coluzzii TaxID=1518534 RepID=UPI0020FFC4C2|nr:uncharacterized protein LOC120950750 [Anopheles coluzzii]